MAAKIGIVVELVLIPTIFPAAILNVYVTPGIKYTDVVY